MSENAAIVHEGADTVDSLILDLLEWIGPDARSYAETLEAWRTSCPRLPVWEEANARGFVTRRHRRGGDTLISVSEAGRAHLRRHRQPSAGGGAAASLAVATRGAPAGA